MLTGPAARASLPPWLITVLGAAGTIVAVWRLHAGAALLGPVLPAFVLTVVVHPLPGWLAGKGATLAGAGSSGAMPLRLRTLPPHPDGYGRR